MRNAFPLLAVVVVGFWSVCLGADSKVDEEGFVRDWLMLAPASIAEESGGDEIEKAQITKEGELQPKEGDKQKLMDKELTWKAVKAADYYLDLNKIMGTAHENVLGYLVAYVVADKEMPGLTLAIGSNDQAKVWVNGKEVYKFTDTRVIEKDTDKVNDVTLKKGVNVIVFKVINQQNDWAAALRFLGKDGKPVTGLGVKTGP